MITPDGLESCIHDHSYHGVENEIYGNISDAKLEKTQVMDFVQPYDLSRSRERDLRWHFRYQIGKI